MHACSALGDTPRNQNSVQKNRSQKTFSQISQFFKKIFSKIGPKFYYGLQPQRVQFSSALPNRVLTYLKPGTHDASNHASPLADGDARTTSNICTCEQKLC